MFSIAVRFAVFFVLVTVFLGGALCLGGLGLGWLLNAVIPSIDFGTAVLIAVVVLGFSGGAVLTLAVFYPAMLQLLSEEEDTEFGEDEEEPWEDAPPTLADLEEAIRRRRSVKLQERSPTPSSKSKRRRRPDSRRGGD